MRRDPEVYLRHILDAIAKAEDYTSGVDERQFARDTLVQDAVIRQIQIIGEAAKRIPRSWQDQHADIPWHDIAGMRDVLVHDYFGVDISQIWQVTREDLPALKASIRHILDSGPQGS